MASRTRKCVLDNRGIVPYVTAWNYQKSLVTQYIENPDLKRDRLILLEHPDVYTLGTGASTEFLQFDPQNSDLASGEARCEQQSWRVRDRELHRIERGGEVTYHCPGQLVAYPILNLKYYQQDLHWYLRQLEEVIIRVLSKYDLDGYRIPGLTGVWLQGKKIAAIGIKVRRWITMHGFAINVCPDLTGFSAIVPCGIKDKPVGSLAQFVPHITVERVKIDVAEAFAAIFDVQLSVPLQPLNKLD